MAHKKEAQKSCGRDILSPVFQRRSQGHTESRVGQNRINTAYMNMHLVIPLPKKTDIHHTYMVLANATTL